MAGLDRTPDVLVVGGGIVGLAAAWHLAAQGARVTVVEREAPGAGTSPAAAGMLAAQVEPHGDGPFFRLACRSRDLWPEWAAALREETGIDVELVQGGILKLAAGEEEAAQLRAAARWQAAAGQPAEWLDARAVAEFLPGVRGVLGGLLCPRDGQVHPGRAVAALAAACQRRGVALVTGTPVAGLLLEDGRVVGVRTAAGEALRAPVTVLAAGAWSGLLAQAGTAATTAATTAAGPAGGAPAPGAGAGPAAGAGAPALPVFPVKGQIVAVVPPPAAAGPWLARGTCVYGPGIYLVPRRDGRLLLGATMEPDAGYDRRPTLGACLQLAQAATALLPALAGATFDSTWTGLRPGTPDGLPLVGWCPGLPGLLLATGHHRNGILLAPLTAHLVASLVRGEAPAELAALAPERFRL